MEETIAACRQIHVPHVQEVPARSGPGGRVSVVGSIGQGVPGLRGRDRRLCARAQLSCGDGGAGRSSPGNWSTSRTSTTRSLRSSWRGSWSRTPLRTAPFSATAALRRTRPPSSSHGDTPRRNSGRVGTRSSPCPIPSMGGRWGLSPRPVRTRSRSGTSRSSKGSGSSPSTIWLDSRKHWTKRSARSCWSRSKGKEG